LQFSCELDDLGVGLELGCLTQGKKHLIIENLESVLLPCIVSRQFLATLKMIDNSSQIKAAAIRSGSRKRKSAACLKLQLSE
jgi:hypothetical protein